LEPEKVPLVVGKLFVLGYFRMFAEEYHDAHGDAALTDFEADAAAFDEFVAWVAERGFDFYPEGYAETLPDNGREFAVAAIEKEREAVMTMLTREVLREVAGDAEAYKYWRRHDPWLADAVEELS
jgi:hypothetical protein